MPRWAHPSFAGAKEGCKKSTQKGGYCPLRSQKPPCSNLAYRGGGDGVGKYREVAPCRRHLVFYRTFYTPPLEKKFFFICFRKVPFFGFPTLL